MAYMNKCPKCGQLKMANWTYCGGVQNYCGKTGTRSMSVIQLQAKRRKQILANIANFK